MFKPYHNFHVDNNAQHQYEGELDDGPGDLFARRLAKAMGISIWHARTALLANGVTGGRDD
jgi:hypothetical protein